MEEYQTQPASRACSFPPPSKLGGIQEQNFMKNGQGEIFIESVYVYHVLVHERIT